MRLLLLCCILKCTSKLSITLGVDDIYLFTTKLLLQFLLIQFVVGINWKVWLCVSSVITVFSFASVK